MTEVKIKMAQEKDLPLLLTFEQGVVTEERPFNAGINEKNVRYYDLNDLLTSEQAALLVAEHQGRIVGSGYAQLRQSKDYLNHDRHAYLGFMYVLPKYRGQGINKKIINALMDWSQAKGVKDFYLDVYAGNEPAIRAYEKIGFEPSLIEMKLNR